jgi:hypothetical protein
MAVHTFEEIKKLVQANNKSKELSNESIICLIWKESGFDAAIIPRGLRDDPAGDCISRWFDCASRNLGFFS